MSSESSYKKDKEDADGDATNCHMGVGFSYVGFEVTPMRALSPLLFRI